MGQKYRDPIPAPGFVVKRGRDGAYQCDPESDPFGHGFTMLLQDATKYPDEPTANAACPSGCVAVSLHTELNLHIL